MSGIGGFFGVNDPPPAAMMMIGASMQEFQIGAYSPVAVVVSFKTVGHFAEMEFPDRMARSGPAIDR
ncbi:MAG: hypothetical protein R3C40_03310 [Parvularculaceae bacterium]